MDGDETCVANSMSCADQVALRVEVDRICRMEGVALYMFIRR
jgi:hypothetical protein